MEEIRGEGFRQGADVFEALDIEGFDCFERKFMGQREGIPPIRYG